VIGALRLLPVDQRRAVVLASVHGRTALEISEIEGIPVGTAKTRLRSGLLKLRGELVPESAP
jgi:RNA polymerase sigma-70 factor (ECF subfamily)